MSYVVRTVRGPRADLTTVRGAERLRALEVSGARVASLRGLESVRRVIATLAS